MSLKSIRRYLMQVYNVDTRIRAIKSEMDAIRAEITSIGAVDYSKDRVSTSNMSDLSDKVVRLEHSVWKREDRVDKWIKKRDEISKLIDSVEDSTLSALLRYRYILGLDWKEISKILGFSLAHTRGKLHKKALYQIYKKRIHKNP